MNETIDTQSLIEKLRRAVSGEVLAGELDRGIYATDASMYQIEPLTVVIPKNRDDALAAIRIAAEAGAPILPRGGGTSLTGQTVNRAVVIDFSKYMNRLLELNVDEHWVRVEPGLVRDELNALLKPHGLFFAADPATSNRANVGGMIANNAAGMRSILYGMTIDHTLEVELALSSGEVLTLGELDETGFNEKTQAPGREGEIYREFGRIIDEQHDEILARYPKVVRRSGGYPLDAFAGPKPWNIAKLVCGSEGTLGTMLSAKVNLEPIRPHTGLCLAHFSSMGECLRAIAPIVAEGPSSVELIDGLIIRLARNNLLTRDTCKVIEGDPEGVLVIEAQGQTPEEVEKILTSIEAALGQCGGCYSMPAVVDGDGINAIQTMRKNALGLMTTVRGTRKPTPYIEDAAIPPENLCGYIEGVIEVCRKRNQPVSLFAHASVGLLHIRPLHDLHDPADRQSMIEIQNEVFELVKKYGGAWSGEHGDGIVRGGYNERFFGAQIYNAFREVKRLFDPAGLMNPGKIVDAYPVLENLRYGGNYRPYREETMFHYRSDDGNILSAVELCTGVGECRKMTGSMCPTYMVTRDELHSTRGRANALRLAMTGQLGWEGLSDPDLHRALELCLSCKACKNECPNNVDLARLKSEALYHKHQTKGPKLRDKLFARADFGGEMSAGWKAPLVNFGLSLPPVRMALDRFAGIDKRRPLPKYAKETMSDWFFTRPFHGNTGKRRVALFDDSWMEYYDPAVGRAAVAVLETLGFEVELVRAGDSQRPAISKGMLAWAKKGGEAVLKNLDRFALAGVPVLVCEPSCWSSLVDDLPDLIDDEELGRRIAGAAVLFDEFLAKELMAGAIKFQWKSDLPAPSIFMHCHCHQKALSGIKPMQYILESIPGATVKDSGAGCCGMAGSFGYEKEHYDISVQVAEDKLLPFLEKAAPGDWIVANGFSCRHQIKDLAKKRAMHTAEALAQAIGMKIEGVTL